MGSTDNSEVLICPRCLAKVLIDRKCPVCGKTLDKGDWPSIPTRGDLTPWSITNLVLTEGDDQQYQLPPIAAVMNDGVLRTSLPYDFPEGKRTVRLGGSSVGVNGADINIEGADPLHAVLMLNGRTKTWWLYDCGSTTGSFVNSARIHCHELQVDDVIEIVGVKLVFRGDRIESGNVSVDGMSLTVENLNFEIEGDDGAIKTVLDDVTFSVSAGEFVGVLGPSGCGKSSLIQRIIGLAKCSEGSSIRVNGNRLETANDWRGFLGATAYLPQNVDETLHGALTLSEEMDLFRQIHMPPCENEEQENESCLSTLGLLAEKNKGTLIAKLSGGQKRRVGIALALLRRPQMLILDEPSAGLDPASDGVLMRHLRGIADQGRTVLCVTHVLTHADQFDKVLVLSKGKVVYFGVWSDLLKTFNVKDLGAFYQLLEDGLAPVRYNPSVVDRAQSDFPIVARPTFKRRVLGYLKRTFKEFVCSKKSKGLVSLLASTPAVFCLWQPLGLVIGIRLACACYFRTNGGRAIDVELLGFCSALAMFWVGINNAAREFVKERIPRRCMERLNQVPYAPYVFSKVLWTIGICALQSLAFSVMLCISARMPIALAAAVQSPSLDMSVLWFGPLYVSCLMGAFCGLAVSSVARKQLGAISIVPNIAILALLFSNAMVRFENNNDYYAPIAKTLATTIMPCYWPSKVLDAIQSGRNDGLAVICMLSLFAIYAIVAFAVVWVFQKKNEDAWDGR